MRVFNRAQIITRSSEKWWDRLRLINLFDVICDLIVDSGNDVWLTNLTTNLNQLIRSLSNLLLINSK